MNTKQKYNKSEIMRNAWQIFRSNNENLSFADSLRQSWNIAKNGYAINHIEDIYRDNYKQIYNLIYNKVGRNSDAAQELTNDVFIKFMERIQYDVYRAKITTLLYVIAKNAVIDYYRTNHQDRYTNVSNYTDSEGNELFQFNANTNTNDRVENREAQTEIAKAFRSLKPSYRKVATLFFLRERSYEEIAEMLDMPLGSVKGMINRVRTMLKKQLTNLHQTT